MVRTRTPPIFSAEKTNVKSEDSGSSSAGVAYFLDTALSTCVTNCSITYFNDAGETLYSPSAVKFP